MANLTDKWKKGELPFGWYYIKIADIVFIDFFEGKVWKNKKDKYIDEVLAEVPNYEEWQDLKSKLQLKETAYDFDTARLEEENNKLKELLKECHDILYEMSFKLKKVTDIDKCCEARKKIRDVLGEEYGFQKVTYYIRNRAKDLGDE